MYGSGLNYIKMPRSVTEYTLMKGVTDFSNLKQFDVFESGYSFFTVVGVPEYMTILGKKDTRVKNLQDGFVHLMEGEFRGLTGIPDIVADAGTLTNGTNELQLINNVTMDTSIQVEMELWERSGGLITNYLTHYLTGIKDPYSKAKTYHGLVGTTIMDPGPQYEVFTFLYYVTDNTMRKVEKAYLLANAQPTTAPTSTLYNTTKGTIDYVPITVTFNCFPIMGDQINKYAAMMLQNDISVADGNSRKLVLDFNDYQWAVQKGGYKADGSGAFNNNGIVENTGLVSDILSNTSYSNIVETRTANGQPLGN
jgi:hypothetical protein